MLVLRLDDFGKEHTGTSQMDFDGAEGNIEFLGYFLIGEFVEVTHFDNATIARFELFDNFAEKHASLVIDKFFFGIGIVGRKSVFDAVVVTTDAHIVEGDCLHALFADKIDEVVAGNGEKPSAEIVLRSIRMKLAKSLAESFYGQVVGFSGVVGHAEKHEVDGFAIETHKVGIGTLVAFVSGGEDQLIVAYGSFVL